MHRFNDTADTYALHANDCIFDDGLQNTCYDCFATEHSITGVIGTGPKIKNGVSVSQ